MIILYWILSGLIFSFLLIQIIRWADKKSPYQLDSEEWRMIFISFICPSIGSILIIIGLCPLIYEYAKFPFSIKRLFNFLIKERKL